jgi:hypothetical protein
MPWGVTLDAFEVRAAVALGLRRAQQNKAAGLADDTAGGQSAVEVHVVGALGEIAFARVANVYPDLAPCPRIGGVDSALASGLTVDVKATRALDGNLLEPVSKAKHPSSRTADVCVLARVAWTEGQRTAEVELVGWAWTVHLRQTIREAGMRTPAYFRHASRLARSLPLVTWPEGDPRA